MKTLQQLPGVAVGTEGMTGLYVRGAGPMRICICWMEIRSIM